MIGSWEPGSPQNILWLFVNVCIFFTSFFYIYQGHPSYQINRRLKLLIQTTDIFSHLVSSTYIFLNMNFFKDTKWHLLTTSASFTRVCPLNAEGSVRDPTFSTDKRRNSRKTSTLWPLMSLLITCSPIFCLQRQR